MTTLPTFDAPRLTARDVDAMLTRHYLPEGRPAGGILALEVGSPCGKRRADAIWAPLTASGGGLVGHEIKVSRGDLITELADPTKPDPWLRYCERWWLTVSDPAIVEGLQVPEAWGIMAPPSGRRTRSMTILRPAPKLKPESPAPAYARLLAWNYHRQAEAVENHRRTAEYAERDLERARTELRELRASGGSRKDPAAIRLAGILEQVRKATSREWIGEPTDDEVVAALVDTVRTRAVNEEARRRLERAIGEVRRATDPLAGITDQLERVAVGLPKRSRP